MTNNHEASKGVMNYGKFYLNIVNKDDFVEELPKCSKMEVSELIIKKVNMTKYCMAPN